MIRRRHPLTQLALLLCTCLAVPFTAAAVDRPNSLIILADGLGWNDVGFSGNSFVDTPALDGLAARGVFFDRAFASAPTRACLLTGQTTPRHGTDYGGFYLRCSRGAHPVSRVMVVLSIREGRSGERPG